MKRSAAILAGAAGVALALSGCSNSAPTDEGEAPGSVAGPVKHALSSDPGVLNPILNATASGEALANYGYESLLIFPPGQEAAGVLAESWEATTTEATFTLKEDIVCVDGSQLTASDVKNTFEYAKEAGSPYAGVYFNPGVEVTADDAARTVTFANPAPDSFLAETVGALPIICAAGLEDTSKLDNEQIGTGPYKMTASSPGQSYTFELRDDYSWGPSGVAASGDSAAESVEVLVVESESTRANMLQSGELTLASVGGTERDRLDDAAFTQVQELPTRPGLVFFNQAEGRPTHDHAVRLGIAQALNRDEIGQVASSGRGKPLVSLVPEFGAACTTMDSSAAIPDYDPTTAATTLDTAGWAVGSDGIREKGGQKLSVKLLFPVNESPAVTAAIELMQVKLKEIGVDGIPTPSPSYTDVIFSGGDWDLVWAPISTSLPSNWAGILGGEFPPNGGNWTYNTNQEYFDLVAEANQFAGEEGCGTWEAAQSSLFSNLEVLPFYSSTETVYGSDVNFGFTKFVLAPVTFETAQ